MSFSPLNAGRAGAAVLAALILLNLGVRVFRIGADPPLNLPNRFDNLHAFKEEGAKSHEARNWALFGAWKTAPLDQYAFWRYQSPVWVFPLAGVFKLFGVGFTPLRMVSVVMALLSLVWTYLLVAGLRGKWIGLAAAAMLGFNYYYLAYSRLGLIETTLFQHLLLSALLAVRGIERPRLLVASLAVFALAALTKQSAFVFLPVPAAAGLAWALGNRDVPLIQRLRVPIAVLAAGLAVLAILAAYEPFRLRLLVNIAHMLHFPLNRNEPLLMVVRPEFVLANLRRFWSLDEWRRGYFMMLPIAGPAALIEIGLQIRDFIRGKRDNAALVVILWWALSRLSLSLISYQLIRFHLIQTPPTIILAALFLARLVTSPRPIIKRLAPAAAALDLVLNLVPWAQWAARPTYELIDASRRMEKLLAGRPAVIIGEWAAPLSLEASYKYYYVRKYFNRDKETIASFHVTHLLESQDLEDGSCTTFNQHFPARYALRTEVAEFNVAGRRIILYERPPETASPAGNPPR